MTPPPTLAISLVPSLVRRIAGARDIGHLHQYRCVESWRAGGFQVVSVNAADEADAVRAAYPDVPVVVAQRDARDLCGRPLIPVSEMLHVLRANGVAWGGIARADVRVADPSLVRRLVEEGRNGGMAVFLHHADTVHPCDDSGVFDPSGPSAAFFGVGCTAALDLDPFTLGLPGWARSLAIALLLGGAPAVCPPGATLLHLDHPRLWGDDLHLHFFNAFRARFSRDLAALQGTTHAAALPSLPAAADLGRHAAAYADLAAGCGEDTNLAGTARRHRAAYAAAVADLIRELSLT